MSTETDLSVLCS